MWHDHAVRGSGRLAQALGFTVLHPSQFQVNEAWVAFKLNRAPVRTERDGLFNCICLMDAASCFILGTAFFPASESEPSKKDAEGLLKSGWKHKKEFPKTLFVPPGSFSVSISAEAERKGIAVIPVHEGQLLIFTGEARQSFREHFEAGEA